MNLMNLSLLNAQAHRRTGAQATHRQNILPVRLQTIDITTSAQGRTGAQAKNNLFYLKEEKKKLRLFIFFFFFVAFFYTFCLCACA